MAWIQIGTTAWEYNDAPVEPSVLNVGQHALWSEQVAGIRVDAEGFDIYTECRLIGSLDQTDGELCKSYFDTL